MVTIGFTLTMADCDPIDIDDDADGHVSHHSWHDESIGLGHHVIYNDSMPIGGAVRWEWRYMKEYLEFGTELWDFWKQLLRNEHIMTYMHNLCIPKTAFLAPGKATKHKQCPERGPASKDISKTLAQERTVTTLGMLGLLCSTPSQSRSAKSITKGKAINCLLSLLCIGLEHGYALVKPLHLVLPVYCPGLLADDHSTTYVLLCSDGYLTGMDGVFSNFSDLAHSWQSFPGQWLFHSLRSSMDRPLLRDLILVLLHSSSTPKIFKDPTHIWHTCGKHILATVLWLLTHMIESYVVARVVPAATAPDSAKPLPQLKGRGGKNRRFDVCNKLNWLKEFRKVQSLCSSVLQRLTSNTLAISQQKGVIGASFSFYMSSLADAFSGIHRLQLVWDSSNHHEDTMVFIMWSNMNCMAGYPSIQVLQKHVGSDIDAAGDDSLKLKQLEGKLKLESAYAYIKSVQGALLSVKKSLDDFRCPKDLLLAPVTKNHVRVRDDSGIYWIVNTITQECIRQIPDNFSWNSLPLLCNMIDQSQIGVAACFHMGHQMQLMVLVMYDYYHRAWNDIKNAAKTSNGFFFSIMLKYSLVFNLNYGPFGKGGWFNDKKDFLKEVEASLTHTHPFFRERAHAIAKDQGWDEPVTEADYEKVWHLVLQQSHFQKKGSLCKIMRWFSFFESCKAQRKDLNSLKLVLDWHYHTLTGTDAAAESELPPPVLPLNQPDPKAELAEMKKALGGLRLAAKIITPDSLWSLDCLYRVVAALWLDSGDRAIINKTPADFKTELLGFSTTRAWIQPLKATLANMFYDQNCFEHLSLYEGMEGYSQDKLDDMCDFTLHVISNRAMSLIGFETEPPYRYVGLLSQDSTLQQVVLQKMKLDWSKLMDGELALAADPSSCKALTACCWRECLPMRAVFLALEACDYDLATEVGRSALAYFSSMIEVLGDSKCIEDTHQRLRIAAQENSNNVTSRATRHHVCTKSSVLEKRTIKTPDPPDTTLALEYWRKRLTQIQIQRQTQTSSVKPTEKMLSILTSADTSPTPAVMFQSVVATSWFLDGWCQPEHAQVSMNAPWQSIMVGQHSVLRHKDNHDTYFSLVATCWGVMTWKLLPQEIDQEQDLHTWSFDLQPDAIGWKYVINHIDWEVVPFRYASPTRHSNGCIRIQQVSPARSVLCHGLLAGVAMTKDQVVKIIEDIGSTGYVKSASKDVLLLHLVKEVFTDSTEADAAMNAYSSAGVEVELGAKVDKDADLGELLEENDMADDANLDEARKLKQARSAKRKHAKTTELAGKIKDKLREKAAKKHKAMQSRIAKTARGKGNAKAKVKAKAKARAKAKAKAKARPKATIKGIDEATSRCTADGSTDDDDPPPLPPPATDLGAELFGEDYDKVPDELGDELWDACFADMDCGADSTEGPLPPQVIQPDEPPYIHGVHADLPSSLPDTIPVDEPVLDGTEGPGLPSSSSTEAAPPEAVAQLPEAVAQLPDAVAQLPDASAPKRRAAATPAAKQYFTPDCMNCLNITQSGAGVKLDQRAHRFIANFTCAGEQNLQKPYHQKTFSKNFHRDTPDSWKTALQQVHEWLWTKWQMLPDTRPVPTVASQEPGTIPQHLISELEITIPHIPDKAIYGLLV